MKTEIELEEAILAVLKKIRAEFPELIKYINEIPFGISSSSNPLITTNELEAYLNSLHEIYAAYSNAHSSLDASKMDHLPLRRGS
jgi:sugar-specific transcriptional regulator TrmB